MVEVVPGLPELEAIAITVARAAAVHVAANFGKAASRSQAEETVAVRGWPPEPTSAVRAEPLLHKAFDRKGSQELQYARLKL